MSLHPAHGWYYCGTEACSHVGKLYTQQSHFCRGCGQPPTPCLTCRCGKEINPWYVKQGLDQFCEECGTAWTADYLDKLMAEALRGMVQEIAKEKGVTDD